MFGRGQRDELDDEEGKQLTRELRKRLAEEVRRVVMSEEGVALGVSSGMDARTEHRPGMPRKLSGKL